tara:strand:- start:783 stop:1274 length:492 start_codon:yes stop_codon:yes gene_type:complete
MNFQLSSLPRLLKISLSIFLFALAFGYFSSFDLLKQTTDLNSQGVEENVLGNEMDESANELRFKMSERELHGIIHSHVISLSLIFVFLQILLYFSSASSFFKAFLMVEPIISIITTFGGLWMLWLGHVWVKYLIMVSGTLMHLSLALILFILLYDLLIRKAKS